MTSVPRWTNALLLLASVGLTGMAVCAAGWVIEARRGTVVTITDLSTEDRQRLVEEFFEVTGRAYSPAWFEPQLAYTLHRDAEISVWRDSFRSNELGFRAGPAAKPGGVFRIVMVGDSWTYGMGVSYEESFPAQLQALANRMVPETSPRIEVWPLALPGYNTFNEMAALELFFDRLEPDAVVLCPTRNDNDSNYFVMPNGTNKRGAGNFVDRFGHDQFLMYRYRFPGSFRWYQRWQKAFAAVDDTERWLAERDVPFSLFFVAYWEPAVVHYFLAEAGIGAPYLIAPRELTSGRWRGAPPWYHGTPEAYTAYSRMIYRSLAEQLGWPSLHHDPALDPYPPHASGHSPPGDWRQAMQEVVREESQLVPVRFERGGEDVNPCMGELDCSSGLMGRKSTVLLRRSERSRRLNVLVERLEEPTHLYPLTLTASIPTAAGGTRTVTTVPATGARRHRFVLDLPVGVAPGEVMDVELRAERVTLAPDVFALRSLYLVSLEQEP